MFSHELSVVADPQKNKDPQHVGAILTLPLSL